MFRTSIKIWSIVMLLSIAMLTYTIPVSSNHEDYQKTADIYSTAVDDLAPLIAEYVSGRDEFVLQEAELILGTAIDDIDAVTVTGCYLEFYSYAISSFALIRLAFSGVHGGAPVTEIDVALGGALQLTLLAGFALGVSSVACAFEGHDED